MPGMATSPWLAVGKGADARQHDPLGRAHVFRVGRHLDLERRAAFPRRALEGLGGGMQVPRTVIDDGDVHVGSSLREEPDDLLALSALNRRRRFRLAARLAPRAGGRATLACCGSQAVKNERSASIRSRPLATPASR